LVLPGGVGAVFLIWERRWATLFDRRILWSVLTFLLVAAPWYILVGVITHAHFLTGFFFTHNVDRFISTMENHRGSILYYPLVILLGSAPWSLFAAGTVWTGPNGWTNAGRGPARCSPHPRQRPASAGRSAQFQGAARPPWPTGRLQCRTPRRWDAVAAGSRP
jgi:4-amino-4-deoxy-L-arabinose transferase-like glycosyltransferase